MQVARRGRKAEGRTMMSTSAVLAELAESIAVKRAWSVELVAAIVELADRIAKSQRNVGKLVLFGNGGSAADAQHIAAEFVGRYLTDREPMRATALHCNGSAVTGIANDYGFGGVFERQIRAWVTDRDVAIGISTSGDSENVVRGLRAARERGAFTAALTGEGGGQCAAACDLLLAVPSRSTPRIQESHITIGHILAGLVEKAMVEAT
jgi:D-sedoheptulose 7-phosphate isomerase